MERHGLLHDPATHLLDVVSEVGELAKLLIQASSYGLEPVQRRNQFSGELGDVLYSLLALASALDVDSGEALDAAPNEYERRMERRGHPGSSSS